MQDKITKSKLENVERFKNGQLSIIIDNCK